MHIQEFWIHPHSLSRVQPVIFWEANKWSFKGPRRDEIEQVMLSRMWQRCLEGEGGRSTSYLLYCLGQVWGLEIWRQQECDFMKKHNFNWHLGYLVWSVLYLKWSVWYLRWYMVSGWSLLYSPWICLCSLLILYQGRLWPFVTNVSCGGRWFQKWFGPSPPSRPVSDPNQSHHWKHSNIWIGSGQCSTRSSFLMTKSLNSSWDLWCMQDEIQDVKY